MTTYKTLALKLDDRILTISLDRPQALNALNHQIISELDQAFSAAANDDNVGGIIITGSGEKAFAAGADIKEIAALTPQNAQKFSENGQKVFSIVEHYKKPVIAAVNGFALGGGCELAMSCHFRVASDSAQFGLPEVSLGLIPGYGGTQRLAKLIGKARALELMMTAKTIKADEALRIGLINHLVEGKMAMLVLANKLMTHILNNAPLAIGMVIESANASESINGNGYKVEATSFAKCFSTKDFKEGISAFLDKRKPQFEGK